MSQIGNQPARLKHQLVPLIILFGSKEDVGLDRIAEKPLRLGAKRDRVGEDAGRPAARSNDRVRKEEGASEKRSFAEEGADQS
mgnify:CR=1 FL=1